MIPKHKSSDWSLLIATSRALPCITNQVEIVIKLHICLTTGYSFKDNLGNVYFNVCICYDPNVKLSI